MFASLLCLLPLALPCQTDATAHAPLEGPPGRLLVLEKNAARALLLDTRNGKTITSWAVGDGPHEVAVSPDGRRAVVSNYGGEKAGSSLSVIELLRMGPPEPLRTIELEQAVRPHGLVFAGDSRHLWMTAEIPGELWRINLDTGRAVARVKVGEGLGHMVARADDSHLFVSHIGAGAVTPVTSTDHGSGTATGPAAWRAQTRIVTGSGAEGIAVQPSKGLVWVTNRADDTISLIDPKQFKVVANLPCAGFPIRVVFSPDGALAAVSCAEANVIALYDAASHELLARVSTGDGSTPIGMSFNHAGSHLYVSCSGADQIADLDLRLRKVVQRFATGAVPDGIVWLPPMPAQTLQGSGPR